MTEESPSVHKTETQTSRTLQEGEELRWIKCGVGNSVLL